MMSVRVSTLHVASSGIRVSHVVSAFPRPDHAPSRLHRRLSPLGDHVAVFDARVRRWLRVATERKLTFTRSRHGFPDLSSPAARDRFLQEYLAGYLGHVRGLAVEPMIRAALAESTTIGDFLPRLMARITEAQRMDRWLEGTPAHVLCMESIKASVPDALFVHVIRDGRDCALSTARQYLVAPLGLDRRRATGVAALYWEWMVRAGRTYGGRDPADYHEVRFEELVGEPQRALEGVGRFIGHTLDFERIAQSRVHALKQPNTSFREERAKGCFNPVGRWKAPEVGRRRQAM